MDLGIQNKRVLISGASNGIGKELAYLFAKEGCHLTLLARSKMKLKHITNELGGSKKGHYFFDIDLSNMDFIPLAIEDASSGLINIAAFPA